MATTKLKIENGKFVKSIGRYVHLLEDKHAIANGWECWIKDDGTIECEASRKYSNGRHTIRYVIKPNGYALLTLNVPNKEEQILKKGFVIPKGGALNGLIGLAGNHIDKRYAYFRDTAFQSFLEEHGISAVKYENPNKNFVIRDARYGGGECRSDLYTDGTITKGRLDFGRSKEWQESWPNTSAAELDMELVVTGAKWAIHKQSQHEGNNHNCFCILYTLEKDLSKLVGLPTKNS